MRWIGALMLTFGTTGLGLFYRRAGYERIRELERMIWFFYYLESEITYHKAELEQICRRGGERQKGRQDICCLRLPDAWRERRRCI